MAQRTIGSRRLFDLYTRYVDEPRSRKDVYGYWTLIAGYLIGITGILVFLSSADTFAIREISIALAASGLAVGLFGIVLLLPVKPRGIYTALLGTVVAVAAVGWFVVAYPHHWGVGTPDYRTPIIAVYTAGVSVIAAVAALVPVVTGQQSYFFEQVDEATDEHAGIIVGRSMTGALFALYKHGADWTWRLIEQHATAQSTADYVSKLETEESVERVKTLVRQAGLLEIKHAAFRIHEAGSGFRWLLMRDDGSVVADSGTEFPDRDAAAASVSYLKDHGPDAPVVSIDGAAYDVAREDDGWYWYLLDDHRSRLARSAAGYDSPETAAAAITTVKHDADGANHLAIDRYGVELYDQNGNGDDEHPEAAWSWRLVDATDTELLASADTLGSRSAAESEVYGVLGAFDTAVVGNANHAGYEVYEEDGWRWRLVTPSDEIVARNAGMIEVPGEARTLAEEFHAAAPSAGVAPVTMTAFEYYRTGDGWRWRLVTPDRTVLAESTQAYENEADAARAVEEAKTQAANADLIEFDTAAFQLYEAETGGWRWRLIDEDGNVMADSGEEHATRDGAATAMVTLKEHAPDAELIEIDTAAFEFFQNDRGEWNWRLVAETGQTTTQGPAYYETKDGARRAMDRLVDEVAGAEVRGMDHPGFQVYSDGEDWRWRFVRPDGRVIAMGPRSYGTRDEAETVIDDDVRGHAGTDQFHTLDTHLVQVVPRGERWAWRVIDRDRALVASSRRVYADEEAAMEAVQDVCAHASDIPVFAVHAPTFQLLRNDGWRWRLVDADHHVLAVSPGAYETRDEAAAVLERVRRVAPDADLIDFQEAAFEVYEDDGWRWRLIDHDNAEIASGTTGYDDEAAAREAITMVKRELGDASILEIDTAAFELHETSGSWHWRLVDQDGNEHVASLRSFDTRSEATEAIEFVKTHATDAITTAAD